jgi:sporulation protein YlmC with PRC-barrel domain
MDFDVENSAGESLGSIHDIMIDLATGNVAYAVLSFGGFLGLGEKLFAIPWSKLVTSDKDKTFILDVPKEKLDAKRGFDKDNWPDFSDPACAKKVTTIMAPSVIGKKGLTLSCRGSHQTRVRKQSVNTFCYGFSASRFPF